MSDAAHRPQIAGRIFDVDTFAVHDGPGIRMAVYMKGCPLHCAWCHSPESQRPDPEIALLKDRCVYCGTCQTVCPQDEHDVAEGHHAISRHRCTTCGSCIEHCARGALISKGYTLSADQIVGRAVHMRPFFDHSGGGVTLTGGEVSQQAEFAEALLAGCREAGIHTAIETCGLCAWPTLERLSDLSDLVLYDLKLIEDGAHYRWTGASNRPILENAQKLASHGSTVLIRVPLIPGVTDTQENLRGIFDFMRRAGLDTVELLPYNAAAPAKYAWLGREYSIVGEPQTADALTRMTRLARDTGLTTTLSGA